MFVIKIFYIFVLLVS